MGNKSHRMEDTNTNRSPNVGTFDKHTLTAQKYTIIRIYKQAIQLHPRTPRSRYLFLPTLDDNNLPIHDVYEP